MIGRLLDWVLGPRCSLCGERVFPADFERHLFVDHAGGL